MTIDDAPLIKAREWAKASPSQATLRHNACMKLLELTPGAIEAFRRRQEILIASDKWPCQDWYSDEDFCRAINTAIAMQERVKELELKQI